MYLDPTTGDMSFGGRTCRLRPQAFAVLEFLVRQGSDFVSRRELEAQIWPNARVTRNSLDQSVAMLRRDLAELPGLDVITSRGRG